MKKLYIILALVVVSILMVFAGDTIKILRVYHNGTFTAIPLANIDSIDHSRFDANGIIQTNYTSSVIDTQDSTYIIPISEIDSTIVEDVMSDELINNIQSIKNFVVQQGEQELDEFQDKLLKWLKEQLWTDTININPNRDWISVRFKNGIEFSINFCSINLSEDDRGQNRSNYRAPNSNTEYYNVASRQDKEIIESRKAKYIRGMALLEGGTVIEYDDIQEILDSSPLNLIWSHSDQKIDFIGEEFSSYGLLFISDTHGVDDDKNPNIGSFQVKASDDIIKEVRFDKDNEMYVFIAGLEIYVTEKNIFKRKIWGEPHYVYWIKPFHLSRILKGSTPVIFANYCYSFYLTKDIHSSTIYGYLNKSYHSYNKDAARKFVEEIGNGATIEDAYNSIIKAKFQSSSNNQPTLSRQSKQRYFSIRTDSLTDDGEIVGRIKGYENLKKNLKWVVYVHDGSDEFKPSDEGVEEIQDVVEVKADGSFKVKSDVYYDNPWSSYIVAFKYNGKVYYGGQKYAGMCPNENHPHKRDLGLSVKWACCNVGATMPFEIGYFYQWGDNERFYEWSNKEYKYWKDSNHKECKFIGYNISGNPDHDGATHLWGKHWRMPTVAECEELLKNCVAVEYNEWYEVLGRIKGDYVFSNKNGNWMFLPYYWNSDGGYWTGNAVPENERKDMWQEIPNFAAYSLILNEPRQTGYIDYEYQPFIGQDKKVFMASIRPVYVEFADE